MTSRLKELKDLLKVGCASDDPIRAAYCGNYLFEERVLHRRQTNYEEALQGQASDFDAWDLWHRNRYLAQAIYRKVPETFTDLNTSAAHSGDLQEKQRLVRIENLKYALHETGLTIAELQEILAVATNKALAGKYDAIDAQAALEDICASLNRNPHSVRPRFASFFQDVADTIDASDWGQSSPRPLRTGALRSRAGRDHARRAHELSGAGCTPSRPSRPQTDRGRAPYLRAHRPGP